MGILDVLKGTLPHDSSVFAKRNKSQQWFWLGQTRPPLVIHEIF
jgi:hypothetical protein